MGEQQENNDEKLSEFPKSVRLSQEQNDYFERNSITFSDWVRKRVDEAITKEKGEC